MSTINALQSVAEQDPDNPAAFERLGYALREAGRDDEALIAFRRAIVLYDPNNAETHFHLGNALQLAGRNAEAVASFDTALKLQARYAEAHCHRGAALFALGNIADARAACALATELNPSYARAWMNLGVIEQGGGNLAAAHAAYSKAIALDPNYAEAYSSLGMLLLQAGKLQEAIRTLRQALEKKSSLATAHSSLLFALHYDPASTHEQLTQEARNWGRIHAPSSLRMPAGPVDANPARRLRIGYVSGDLCDHPVGFFVEQIFAHHDRSQFHVTAYANQLQQDKLTQKLQQHTDVFRSIYNLPDDEVARMIRADGIDILIDLSGHTARNRLLVFARKPAPIQMTWLGYFDTTGMEAMDYIIADPWVIPPAEESFYTERPLRLPEGYLCFSPPSFPIEVEELPVKQAEYLTFGSFCNASKISEQVVDIWAAILQAVPHARLYLKHQSFGDPTICANMRERFGMHDIEDERLMFAGYSPREELLREYNKVDIALDTFPYNGGTTSVEALWMGVPTITLSSTGFANHVGESILQTVGLPQLVARDTTSYIQCAVALAGNIPALASMRQVLRAQMLDSPICNGERFTHNLEAAYRTAWTQWCGKVKEAS